MCEIIGTLAVIWFLFVFGWILLAGIVGGFLSLAAGFQALLERDEADH